MNKHTQDIRSRILRSLDLVIQILGVWKKLCI
jgi:hypothetical protein